MRSSITLDLLDLCENFVQSFRHKAMHANRLIALDEVRLIAVSKKQICELLVR